MTTHEPNWAERFIGMLIASSRNRDYRAAHANRGTPRKARMERRHGRTYGGGSDRGLASRLVRRAFQVSPSHEDQRRERFREMQESSILRIAGTNPTPERLEQARAIVGTGYSRV